MRGSAVGSTTLSGGVVVEGAVLVAKVLGLLLQQRCCWADPGFSASPRVGDGEGLVRTPSPPHSPLLCSQMTTLEAVESPESLAAVAYLLNLVLKR